MTVYPAPRETADLIGHQAVERLLLAAWRGGRLPHAWMIAGISGIGKATLAFRFARFVLANSRPAGDLPGDGGGLGLFGAPAPPAAPADSLHLPPEHPVFRRVRAGGHADLLTVERHFDEKRGKMKTDIAVEDVREVASFLRRTAAEGGWRVVIIDGVEQMNASGHNALLKILEEPPPRALLLLVTEAPGGLLPTIRSRCRKLVLNPLPEAAVSELLARLRPDLAEADRAVLTHLAEGSIGRALGLADAGGLELYRRLIAVLATLPQLDLRAVHVFADSLVRKDDNSSYRTATELLVWWLARLVRALALGVMPVEIVPGEAALITRLVAVQPTGGVNRWLEVWEQVSRMFARADYANLDRKQVILNALLGIAAATA